MDNVQSGRGTDGLDRPSSRPGALRRLGLPAAALSLALGAAQVAAAAPGQAATQSGSVAVGHAPTLPKGAVAAAAPAASKKLNLDIALNTGHAAALSAYAAGVGDRNSPYYHHYLTPSQVAANFGASQAEVSAVEATLKAQGLTVGSLSADGSFISATGTVAQAEHAFGVTIKGYRAAGRSFFANTTAPTLPASVAGDVSGVLGLDSVDYAVPHVSTEHHAVKATSGTSRVTSNYTVNSCSDIGNTYNGSGLSNGSGYYTADAVSNIYGLNPLLANGDDGAGVTVGVFELESFDATGVSLLDGCYGHSSTSVTETTVDGGPSAPANMNTGVGIESALDIENIANLAPGVSIIDYAGPDYTSATDAQILDIFNKMVGDNTAKVISDSWGLCEVLTKTDPTYGNTMQSSENTVFEEAATQGQSILVASGDSGSTDCYGAGVTADDTVLSVDDPASQPYATAVGGTGMTGLSNPKPYTWNECTTYNGTAYCGASGGGVSNTWPLPSWQSAAKASGYSHCTGTVSQGGTGCREVPDVSALADPNDGYVIEEYYNDGISADTGYYYNVVGGTSGAAPVWAAIIALADASATCKVGGDAGFVNPRLYSVGELSKTALSAFGTDVTSGNNEISTYGATSGFSATTGYDMATGWGTPVATGVVSTVCQAPSYYQQDGPTRVLDTRNSTGGVTGPVVNGGTARFQVTGKNGVPSSATAAVLNVTVTSTAGAGNATVYPASKPMPLTSNLNWVKGDTKANLVVVPLNSDGAVKITNNSTGSVQFIADLEGYFTTSKSVNSVSSSSYTPLSPVRAMDTRKGTGVPQAKLAAKATVSLKVGGTTLTTTGGSSENIPAGITGIAMNVTVTDVTGGGYLAVFPNETSAGTAEPTPNVSNLNFGVGQTIANTVMIPVGPDGKIKFYNGAASGSVDAIADIAGYYTVGTSGDVYHPLGPVRVVDTRIGEGETSAAPISSKGKLDLGLPSSYAAVVANLTVTQPQYGGYMNAYPRGTATPDSSNVNFGTGQTVPNSAVVQSASGLEFYNNAAGTIQLVVDLSGYFSAS